jgi:hypothetical protein
MRNGPQKISNLLTLTDSMYQSTQNSPPRLVNSDPVVVHLIRASPNLRGAGGRGVRSQSLSPEFTGNQPHQQNESRRTNFFPRFLSYPPSPWLVARPLALRTVASGEAFRPNGATERMDIERGKASQPRPPQRGKASQPGATPQETTAPIPPSPERARYPGFGPPFQGLMIVAGPGTQGVALGWLGAGRWPSLSWLGAGPLALRTVASGEAFRPNGATERMDIERGKASQPRPPQRGKASQPGATPQETTGPPQRGKASQPGATPQETTAPIPPSPERARYPGFGPPFQGLMIVAGPGTQGVALGWLGAGRWPSLSWLGAGPLALRTVASGEAFRPNGATERMDIERGKASQPRPPQRGKASQPGATPQETTGPPQRGKASQPGATPQETTAPIPPSSERARYPGFGPKN